MPTNNPANVAATNAPIPEKPKKACVVVVKSRGHFRGGFDEIFKPEQIYEVDCPGLSSPVLANFNWTKLPRPVYPLDEETAWTPPTSP